MTVTTHMRIARPVSDLARASAMYVRGLGFRIVGSFEDHDGFDGIMLGDPGANYHLEFTRCRNHPVQPSPTEEDLLVLYIPSKPDWVGACSDVLAAGFREVAPFNPYWAASGRTFEDQDGYRVVLQNAGWSNETRATTGG